MAFPRVFLFTVATFSILNLTNYARAEAVRSDEKLSGRSTEPTPRPTETPNNSDWYLDMWMGRTPTPTPTVTPTPSPSPTPTPTVTPTVTPTPAPILSSCLSTGRIFNLPLPAPEPQGSFINVHFGTSDTGEETGGLISNTKCWVSRRDLLTGIELPLGLAVGGGVRTEGEFGMSMNDYERHPQICIGIPSIGFYVTCDMSELY